MSSVEIKDIAKIGRYRITPWEPFLNPSNIGDMLFFGIPVYDYFKYPLLIRIYRLAIKFFNDNSKNWDKKRKIHKKIGKIYSKLLNKIEKLMVRRDNRVKLDRFYGYIDGKSIIPYYCEKCNHVHMGGKIYLKHIKYADKSYPPFDKVPVSLDIPLSYEIIEIRGLYYANSGKIVRKLKVGASLNAIPEDDNPNDKNAIAVYHNGDKLGYVAKERAPIVRKKMESSYQDPIFLFLQYQPSGNVRFTLHLRGLDELMNLIGQERLGLSMRFSDESNIETLKDILLKTMILKMLSPEIYYSRRGAIIDFDDEDELHDIIHYIIENAHIYGLHPLEMYIGDLFTILSGYNDAKFQNLSQILDELNYRIKIPYITSAIGLSRDWGAERAYALMIYIDPERVNLILENLKNLSNILRGFQLKYLYLQIKALFMFFPEFIDKISSAYSEQYPELASLIQSALKSDITLKTGADDENKLKIFL